MKKRLAARIRRSQFEPDWLGVLTNPFYFARAGLLDGIKELAPNVTGRTLDVGCGQKPYRHLFPSSEYIGLELDTEANRRGKRADVFYDGKTIPFPDGHFDSVISSQVFEHVFEPSRFLAEIFRVLKPGGCFVLTVPFVWDEHEQPYDFGRYSTFGLRHMLEGAGFKVEVLRKSMTDGRLLFQLANAMLFKRFASPNRWRTAAAILLTMAPLNVLGLTLGRLFPSGDDLYLDNIALARKPER